jgi:hypothetical protein
VRINTTPYKTTIINTYAHTETAKEEEKDKFYDKLEETIRNVPHQDTIIMVGDFNAQIGKEEHNKNIAGKQTLHEKTNDNGERLCALAARTGMTIASTKFKHSQGKKATWLAPNGRYETQIDHILISRRRQAIIQDVHSNKAACADTDHYLVIAKVKQKKISRRNKKNVEVRWKVDELQTEDIRNKYEIEIANKLQLNPKHNIEQKWTQMKKQIKETADKTIGREEKRKKNSWWNSECEKVVNEKAKEWEKYTDERNEERREAYKEKRTIANTVIEKEKNKWIEKLMEKIETENKKSNARKFYRQVKAMNNNIKAPIKCGLRDSEGRFAETEEEEKAIWKTYFQRILNSSNNDETLTTQKRTEAIDDMEEPTNEEIAETIKELKNGKTAGKDNICNELIKYGGEKMSENIQQMIKDIWKNEQIPEEWKIGRIMPIYKSGDHTKCDNYRGITLLNTAYKILTNIINKRMTQYIKIDEYQCGFLKGRSTVDAIHTVKQIIAKANEYNTQIYIMFIDFRKAFDSIDRKEMIKIIEQLMIPEKLKRVVKMIIVNTKATVITRGGETEEFTINKGIRQGDSLSATLFIIVMDYVVRNIDRKNTIRNRGVQIIAYADDITIVAKNQKLLKETIDEIVREGRKVGLELNKEKTKILTTREQTEAMKIGNDTYECVKTFKYLGITINTEGTNQQEIKEKIMAGNKAYFANSKTLRSKKIEKKTKIKIYKTLIRPIVTYAGETLTMTKRDEQRLEIFERKIIRVIVGPNRMEDGSIQRKTNKEIEEIMEGETITKYIKQQRLRWLGHMWRKDESVVTRQIMGWQPAHNRRIGRPRKTWIEEVKNDLQKIGIKGWEEKTRDREEWKQITKKIK